jgi:hypothetical protein
VAGCQDASPTESPVAIASDAALWRIRGNCGAAPRGTSLRGSSGRPRPAWARTAPGRSAARQACAPWSARLSGGRALKSLPRSARLPLRVHHDRGGAKCDPTLTVSARTITLCVRRQRVRCRAAARLEGVLFDVRPRRRRVKSSSRRSKSYDSASFCASRPGSVLTGRSVRARSTASGPQASCRRVRRLPSDLGTLCSEPPLEARGTSASVPDENPIARCAARRAHDVSVIRRARRPLERRAVHRRRRG